MFSEAPPLGYCPPPSGSLRLCTQVEALSQQCVYLQYVCVCIGRYCLAVWELCSLLPSSSDTVHREEIATGDLGWDICLMYHSPRTQTGRHAFTHMQFIFIGNCWAVAHTNLQTHTLWDKAHTRSAYRDTRRLQRSTWLPKDPEAHVNSSLHPTSGLCILTKHLAVSAPVHHSSHHPHQPPPPLHPNLISPFTMALCLCAGTLEGCIHRKLHSTLWFTSVQCLWVSAAHAYSIGFYHQAGVEFVASTGQAHMGVEHINTWWHTNAKRLFT